MAKLVNLEELGWSSFFEEQCSDIEDDKLIGRIYTLKGRKHYGVLTVDGEFTVRAADTRPGVGDWVIFRRDDVGETITGIIKRKSLVSRKAPGKKQAEQVIGPTLTIFSS